MSCRLWGEFVADLAKSVNCSADTPTAGKGTNVIIPGSKLLGKFDAKEATELPNTTHFGQLGSTLLHAEPQKSYSIGTCNLMISAHTLKTPIRPEAEQEILFKLKSGFRQGLWPVLHLQDPVGHLEMPSRAAENASKTQLLDGLNSALTAVNSGRGSALLQGVQQLTTCQVHTMCFLPSQYVQISAVGSNRLTISSIVHLLGLRTSFVIDSCNLTPFLHVLFFLHTSWSSDLSSDMLCLCRC